jgi:Co/Zn/Cd efflux system component
MDIFNIQWTKQSNQSILKWTAASFLLFVIAELIAARASHSLSLMGDACAM